MIIPPSIRRDPFPLTPASTPAVPAPPPPEFQFYLDKCVITNTRSLHEDTLVAGLGVLLTKGNVVGTPSVLTGKLGDHNNTTLTFWEHGLGSLDNIGIDAETQVTFMYELYNNGAKGHPSLDELQQEISGHLMLQAALNAMNSQNPEMAQEFNPNPQFEALKQQVSQLSAKSLPYAQVYTGGLYSAFYSVLEGCDGIVAAGTYSVSGALLSERIASSPNQVIAQTDTSNGKQNGWGAPCNPHGSNYIVSWIAQARGQKVAAVSV
jgi:hypothetical protein